MTVTHLNFLFIATGLKRCEQQKNHTRYIIANGAQQYATQDQNSSNITKATWKRLKRNN